MIEILDQKLGLIYGREASTFRVYSPYRKTIHLRIYDGPDHILGQEYEMKKNPQGIFETRVIGRLEGKYYNYLLDGKQEVTDPYSIASSINSNKSAIIDLKKTNPRGWEEDVRPDIKREEAIIYELHIKDFTYNWGSGVRYPGKYLGLAESSSRYKDLSTGLDHLRELGITHIHLMPVYDFLTVREEEEFFHQDSNYNWGYDPELFNLPEGSYSTKPDQPENRILELKTMIQAIHRAGMKVVIDVVYNHVYRGWKSNFQALYPNYYLRTRQDGSFSDGAGVGTEMASEKPMFRKFILDSISFWQEEYRVDGFRFDLMGLIDLETMKELTQEAKKRDPQVLIYGEPWTGGDTSLPFEDRTLKGRQRGLGFACFNDDFRNAIKGDNNGTGLGFAMGDFNKKLAVETGIAGSINFDNSHLGFTQTPAESINYINSHDDLIITDKIDHALSRASQEDKREINKLANSIIFLSFGIPFIHQGNEFLRSKEGISNTYKSPISINQVDWSLKEKNYDFFCYFRDLIEMRKKMGVFSSYGPRKIRRRLKFLDFKYQPSIGYLIEEETRTYLVIHNAKNQAIHINREELLSTIVSRSRSGGIGQAEIIKVFDKNGKIRENIGKEDNLTIDKYSTAVFEIIDVM